MPTFLSFIDFDIHRLIEVVVDRAHEQQVVVDIAVLARLRKEQHRCVIADIERDRVVMAA